MSYKIVPVIMNLAAGPVEATASGQILPALCGARGYGFYATDHCLHSLHHPTPSEGEGGGGAN